MNRKFEERKTKKVYAKSKENQAIIKALNMYGRVPEQWELLEKIDRLNKEIKTLLKENSNKEKVIIKQNNIINRMEIDLKEMYMTFGEFNEEYTEKKIRELKGKNND